MLLGKSTVILGAAGVVAELSQDADVGGRNP
jgi:hypothetical protein